MKSHPGFEIHREAKSISRMLVASVMIAVATSAWGCSSVVDSSRAESVDDWNPNPYALFRYAPASISDTSDSVTAIWRTILESRGPDIQIPAGNVQKPAGRAPVKLFPLPPTIEYSKFRRR